MVGPAFSTSAYPVDPVNRPSVNESKPGRRCNVFPGGHMSRRIVQSKPRFRNLVDCEYILIIVIIQCFHFLRRY